jgi:hypothetical protein
MECVGYNLPLFMLKNLGHPTEISSLQGYHHCCWMLLLILGHVQSAKKIHPKPKIWCRVLVWSSFICDWNTWKVCVMCFVFFYNQQSSMSWYCLFHPMVVICLCVTCCDIVVLSKAFKTLKILSFAHISLQEVNESLLKSKLSSYHCIDAYVEDVMFLLLYWKEHDIIFSNVGLLT